MTHCSGCDKILDPEVGCWHHITQEGGMKMYCDDCITLPPEPELCEGYDKGCGCGGCMGKDNAPE